MAKGRRISDDVRAAIMAALLAGQGVTETAKQFNVGDATVSRLKAKLEELEIKKEIPELVMEVLREQLSAIKNIAREASRPDYVKEQPASEIAVLIGVISDKAFRILSAFESEPIQVSQQQSPSEYSTN